MQYSVNQRFHAFIVGLVSASLVLLPAVQALGSPDYSPQGYPASPQDILDATVAINAGMEVDEAIEPSPFPSRKYAVFLSELWENVFVNDYLHGVSGLYATDWVGTGHGVAQGATVGGEPFAVEILLSIEFPNDERSGLTPAQSATIVSSGVTFGIAWIDISTAPASSEKIFVLWIRFPGSSGPNTVIVPIQKCL